MDSTPVSLLERVQRERDPEGWGRFVQLYSPLIFGWARRCGLQAADAADLTQDVFTTLFERLPGFRYDQHRSFRAWLRTLTLNLWRDRLRRVATRPLPGQHGLLSEVEAAEQLALEERDYQARVVGRALQIMEADFQPATWRAFWEHGILGRPAAEVAAELGLTVPAVYCARLRVLNRLRLELRGLLD